MNIDSIAIINELCTDMATKGLLADHVGDGEITKAFKDGVKTLVHTNKGLFFVVMNGKGNYVYAESTPLGKFVREGDGWYQVG